MRHAIAAMTALAMTMPSAAQVVATASIPAPMAAIASAEPDAVTLPAHSEIWLSPTTQLSSKQLRKGDTIAMIVSRDVYVRRELVIPRGTPAVAKVGYRTGKGMYGKSAKIEFDLVSLEVAHRPLAVNGHYRIAGRGNSTVTIVVALFALWWAPAFITGHSAVMPAGSEWRAATAEPVQIALSDGDLRVRSGARLAVTRTSTLRSREVAAYGYPANSAYVPAPAEIFVRTLSPRP